MRGQDEDDDRARARDGRGPPPAASRFPAARHLARVQNRDRSAFRELVERLQDLVVAHALALVGEAELARRAGRAAFLELERRIDVLHDAEEFPRWLRHVVERRSAAVGRAAPGPLREHGDPESLLERVLELPKPEERAVVLLVHLARSSPTDVALFLGVAPSDVHSRLAIAHGRLKKSVVRRLEEALDPLRPSRDASFVESVVDAL
jgi:DNA-directed RNA polymerase specialized sigma24 family protein